MLDDNNLRMKKRKFCLMELLSFGVAFFSLLSCTQEDEHVYSCNKYVNEFVKKNLDEIHQMTRKDWLKTDPTMGRAVYIAFTASQKYNFWEEKFAELKSLSWSEKEMKHIVLAENFLKTHKNLFNEGPLSSSEEDDLDLFFYKWVKDAETNLGWNKNICYSIVATGEKVADTKGNLIVPPLGKSGVVKPYGVEPTCNCHIESDFCGLGNSLRLECGDDPNCNPSDGGCGWFLAQSCNGKCKF